MGFIPASMLTMVSLHVSRCIEYSGVTVGNALDDHPGQLCVPNESPSRWHSRMACRISCRQESVPMALVESLTPVCIGPPTKNCCTPLMPAALKASRSAVMPSLLTTPSIHCQIMMGFAASDG